MYCPLICSVQHQNSAFLVINENIFLTEIKDLKVIIILVIAHRGFCNVHSEQRTSAKVYNLKVVSGEKEGG